MDTGRETVQAAIAARDRGQWRLRILIAVIVVASVLAGLILAGVLSSPSSSPSGTSGLKSFVAPAVIAGSGQVPSGGS